MRMFFKKHKKKFIAGAVLLIAVIIYSLLWGRLFPISPIIIGFEQKELSKAIIYYPRGTNISKLSIIDNLVNEVEEFHRLKFKKKAKILIYNSEKKYSRHTGSKTRFITIHDRIFISDKAKKQYEEGNISLEVLSVYLKHELSHELLFQNMSIYRSQFFPGWLLEGIAVYSSKMMGVDGYLTKKETLNKIKDGYFLNPDDWSTSLLKPQSKNVKNFPLPNKYWFIYSEFACLVDDLIQNFGKENFLEYLTVLLKERDDKKAFQDIFGIEFNKYLFNFRIRAGYSHELISQNFG